MMMHLQAFVVRTGIRIPALHEICRETLNPHIGMDTSNFGASYFCIKCFL